MEEIWKAARDVGKAISLSENARRLASGLPSSNSSRWTQVAREVNNVAAGYGTLQIQPLILGQSLKRLGSVGDILAVEDGPAFLAAAEGVSRSASLIVEWVRSRMPGYPRMLVPHVDSAGPVSERMVLPGSRFPWTHELRGLGLHGTSDPIDLLKGFGADTPPELRDHVLRLAFELGRCERWREFAYKRANLSEPAVMSLRSVRQEFWDRTSDDRLREETGDTVMRRSQYVHQVLAELARILPEEARALWDAFLSVDELLEDVWIVVGHLALRGAPNAISSFGKLEWRLPHQQLKVTVADSGPWDYRLGNVVSIPEAVLPPGFCCVTSSVSLSIQATGRSQVSLGLKVLDAAWPHLTE